METQMRMFGRKGQK